MLIDELLAAVRQNQQQANVELYIPKDWTQGRTAFGGLSAAMTYEAMASKLTDKRELRSFTTNFVGPLNTEQPFSIEVTVLRQGKNATQIEGKAMQNGNVCVLCLAVFAVARTTKISVDNQPKHSMTLPKKPKYIPQIPKITPKFLRHVDLAMIDGSMPFTGSKDSHIHGWMRFTKAPEKITNAKLARP